MREEDAGPYQSHSLRACFGGAVFAVIRENTLSPHRHKNTGGRAALRIMCARAALHNHDRPVTANEE